MSPDAALLAALKSVDFADLCITSGMQLTADPEPPEAFRLPDVPGIGVVFEPAIGEKCERCWKVLPDVGQPPPPAHLRALQRRARVARTTPAPPVRPGKNP